MRRTWRNFLSLLLAFAMVLSLGTTGFALDGENEPAEPVEEPVEETRGTGVELSFEKVDNDIISERLPFAHEALEEEEPSYADDELVRVSIVLDGLSAIDAGYAPANAAGYRAGLRAEQDAMADRISAEVLGGAPLDVVWNITLAGNMISAYVPYGAVEDIRNMIGVKDVVFELQYFPTEDEVENATAAEMTGATAAWNLGYTGAGSRIAIVDTGLDTDHQSFDSGAFVYAIDELNETRETPIVLMTEDDVAAVWDQLNAAQWLDVDGVYRDPKVPYGVNYVDHDYDITHDNDSQGEHGSHVAGIAAANKYIPSGNDYVKALDTVLTQGEAPDAQLLIMKVFGKGGGAYDSDYMCAIEDAMTLGCDSVNLSLGSSSAGMTTNTTYAEILDKLTRFGVVWCNSAGNNYSWTYDTTGANYLYADDVNYQTGGSPATYHNSLSVASVDNKGQVGYYITAPDGSPIFYTETSGYGNEPLNSIAGEYGYILIPGPGVGDNDYNDNAFAALGSEILEGKIGICMRGSSSFFAKANASVEQGAVATIIFNNQAGSISMNLTGYTYTVPVVSITQNEGVMLAMLGEEKEANGVTYYEGTLTVGAELGVSNLGTPTDEFQTMSSFSSWGGNGALTMKPEITAPGGNIWSVNGLASPDGYEIMSGTSMASPQVAGLVAVLKQYIREAGLVEKTGLSDRAIAQSLLMSTSMPLREAATGNYWSIMKQGSGLADVNAAITARSLIQVVALPDSAPESAWNSIADGKVKVELGEVYNGFYTAFNVTNFSEEDMSLYLNGEFFTQWINGGAFRTEYTVPVRAHLTWTVNGEDYVPGDIRLDFNNDGVANGLDAQLLLDWCADDTIEIYNLQNADLDGDGNVDTADAKIAFETLNGAAVELAAGETAEIGVYVAYDLGADEFNGNYIEGFLFVREGDTGDGALGVKHSIPVFGFNGRFSDATMFDRGSRLEYKYEFGDGEEWYPYQYYADPSQNGLGDAALEVETFLVKYKGDSGTYFFGGNPLLDDETYHPERNALNNDDLLYGARFTQIRNSGASRFFMTDKYERVVPGTEVTGGPGYAVYYYRNQSTWQQTTTTASFPYSPKELKEGDELTAHYQLALEYYMNSDGEVRWDDLGAGSEMTIPFVIDNTAPDIVKVYRSTTEEPGGDDYELPVTGTAAEINEGDDETPIVDDGPEPEEPGEEETPAADTLEIITHDNQFIAAVAVFTDEGELLDAQGAVEDTIRGKEVYYSFDLKEIFGDEEVYPYLLVQVYDYALNLSTYKVNFADDLENATVESVTVSPNPALIIGTGTIRLSADVRPWGIDDAVAWSSSDESIAVVDQDGFVTGVAEGTVEITATSLLDPEVFGVSEVEVKFVDKELNGIVWDENGAVWFSEFNLKTLPNYTMLTEDSLRLQMASLTYDENMTLYGATFDSSDMVSSLYTVNPEDWSVNEIGPSSIGYMDICQAPSLGPNILLGVYAYYVVIIDATTGDYLGVFNFQKYTGGNWLVGIAYEEVYNHSIYGDTDWVFLVDEAGTIYSAGFLPYNGNYANFTPSAIGSLGVTCDTRYFQSLYYDGINLYWSCFNMSANKVDMVMVDDLYNDGSVYTVGSFADGVWPVGGLFELGVNPYFGAAIPSAADHSEAVLDENCPFLLECPNMSPNQPDPDAFIDEEEPIEDEEPIDEIVEEPVDDDVVVGGGLDFARIQLPGDAEPEKIETDVVVYITADDLTYNGKIDITFDPVNVKLLEIIPATQFTGVLNEVEELGHFVLAWVDLEGIPADGIILTLKFDKSSVGTVAITTYEENERDADADETLPREELVFLGSSAVPSDHEHEFELAHWSWADDLSAAIAVFACPQDGVSKTYEAEITSEVTTEPTCTEPGVRTYTATVVVDGVEYTDTRTEEVPATGHTYGDPVWTWAEDHASATATFTCTECGDEVVLDAAIALLKEDPTCTEPGVENYTAMVEFEGVEYTDKVSVEVPALGHDWAEPGWVWDIQLTEAYATFRCNRCDEVVQLTGEITYEVGEDNTIIATATVTLDGVEYTDTMTAEAGAIVYGTSLVIGEKFAAKCYLTLPAKVLNDKKAYAEVNGEQILVKNATKVKISKGVYVYAFDFNLGPKMFNDEINVKIFDGEGTQLFMLDNHNNYLPDGYTYKAQDYIDKNIANSSNENFVTMLKALSDFGHYAQVYNNYNLANMAELYGELPELTLEDLEDYAPNSVVYDNNVLTYVGSTMQLQSEIKIRQYYKLASGVDMSTLTFTINGEEVTPVVSGKNIYVQSKNVPAKSFDVAYRFTVKDAEGNVVFESTYSAFSYIRSTLKNTPDDENLVNLVKAMYAYGVAAKAYFGN